VTTSTTPALRVAGPDDIDPIADLVADSFARLDVIAYLVPDPDRRRAVTRAWYRLHIEHAVGGAGQVVMTDDGSAAAVWFDRTGVVTEPVGYAMRLAEVTGDDLPRFAHLEDRMDAGHPHDPHWHLLFLAVRPDRWNHGLGSALMRHTHRRLDATGTAAYLEATGPARGGADNRRLYRRHHYADMEPAVVAVTAGVDLHRMWRPAQDRQATR